ncbi:MAG TPA: DUF4349 domain-containing protein [Burkholderiaceae bacterium]|jgi:hypothetical protein
MEPSSPAAQAAAAPAPAMQASADYQRKAKSSNRADASVAEQKFENIKPEAQLTSTAVTYNDGERKFIRTAHARFRVKDVYRSALAIEDAVSAHAGFVVKNEIGSSVLQSQRHSDNDGNIIELSEYIVNGNLTVRVPSAKTQEFLRAIATQVEFLDQRNFEAHDAQFDLLRQKLNFQRNQETQEELGQATRDGGKLSHKTEAITARNETKAARDEAKIAQKEFEDKIAFSTIELSIYQLSRIYQTEFTDVDAVLFKHKPSLGYRVMQSLSVGWYDLLDFVIDLAKAWPLWIIAALGFLIVRRVMKARSIR